MAFKLPSRVKETTITQSTGDYALAGNVTGFRPFSVLSNGDTTWYYAEGGGLWEFGLGTYSAGSLARTTIFGSSNGGSAVNWPAGTKTIAVGLPGLTDLDATNLGRFRTAIGLGNVLDVPQREQLTASRTYYVRTDGSDSNTGLANTAGGAFLTLQKAMDTIAALDISTFDVTVNVGAGTYTAGLVLKSPVGSGSVTFAGDETTPSNVHISTSSGWPISTFAATSVFNIRGFKLTSSAAADVRIGSRCRVNLQNIEYAGTTNYRVHAQVFAFVNFSGANNKISGGGIAFMLVQTHAHFEDLGATWTLTANVTYSSAFILGNNGGTYLGASVTYTLGAFAVTGSRYSVTLNAVVNTSGGGASFFPGSTAGSTTTGGQYA